MSPRESDACQMTKYARLAMIVMLFGYELDLLTLLCTASYYVSSDGAVQAMFIIAFLCYTVATILVLALNLTDLHKNVGTVLITTTFGFLAFLFLLVGLSIFGSDLQATKSMRPEPYTTTSYSCSMLMALIAGVFLSLHLKAQDRPNDGHVTRVLEADQK